MMRLSSSSSSSSTSSIFPNGSILSYTSGIVTAAGLYHAQSTFIARYEPKSPMAAAPSATPHHLPKVGVPYVPPHKATQPFRPPQTANELYQALGRPFLTRLAAASVSFFCAGAVQAYVARPSQYQYQQQQQHDE